MKSISEPDYYRGQKLVIEKQHEFTFANQEGGRGKSASKVPGTHPNISSVFTDCGEILLSTFSLKIDEPSLA